MNDHEFVHWLNGYLEVSGCKELGEKETAIVKEKLQSVFKKETPTYMVGGTVSSPFTAGLSGGVSAFNVVGDGVLNTANGMATLNAMRTVTATC